MALEARLRKGVTSVQYRKLGNTGLDVSVLSIGAMRLPKEMDEAVALLRQAIDAGCNYIDTSRGYGDSELKLAAALTDGCREKVILSTKCSPWIYKEEGYTAGADDARRKIDDSMQRLAVDRLDFYQVWNVDNAENYAKAIAPGAMVDGIRKAMDEGLVDHIAATTHAPEPVVLGMIDSGLFETITVTYHLLDRRRERVMARAHDKGVGVVVMNPMGGGVLGHPSRVIREFLPESQLSSQALSLKFVLDNPHVSCAISGLSKPSDVVENVQAAETAPLSAAQRDRLAGGPTRPARRRRRRPGGRGQAVLHPVPLLRALRAEGGHPRHLRHDTPRPPVRPGRLGPHAIRPDEARTPRRPVQPVRRVRGKMHEQAPDPRGVGEGPRVPDAVDGPAAVAQARLRAFPPALPAPRPGLLALVSIWHPLPFPPTRFTGFPRRTEPAEPRR